MKDTFHGWATVGEMKIDRVADLIVTGRKANEAVPDEWIFPYIGDPSESLTVLDFGCGFGRNSFGLARQSNWTVVGYDNEAMLGRVKEFSSINYDGRIPKNLWFLSDWEQVKLHRVDRIFCSLVLQHIYEDALRTYIKDFKRMTTRLVVVGRRSNDEALRSTWTILEEQGLVPREFYSGPQKIDYVPEGAPEDHNMAIYTF